MATKKTAAPPEAGNPAIEGVRFKVPEYVTVVSFGPQVYPAVNGVVELPAGESWYRPMVASGELKPAEA